MHWFERSVHEVLEGEDESLLFTLRGPVGFWKPWQIDDAEENRVASISGKMIFDQQAQFQAYLESNADGDGLLLDRNRMELGRIRKNEEGTLLVFHPITDNDPFLRMALLGAALVLA
jgi:hypothetical protein